MRYALPLIAIAAIATPSVAAAEEVVTVSIATADLDLTTKQGRKALDARIEVELRKACKIEKSRSASLFGSGSIDRICLVNARAKARAQVKKLVEGAGRSEGQVAAS